MPAATMFSKFKSGPAAPLNIFDGNPITQYFDIGQQVATAGPEMVWHIYDATKKPNGQECSVFVFEKRCAEKLHKPKRKETVTEILRASIRQLELYRHPKLLNVLHSIEECPDTLAFATEPVMASLANILAFHEYRELNTKCDPTINPQGPHSGATLPQIPQHLQQQLQQLQQLPQQQQPQQQPKPSSLRPPWSYDYDFLNFELKYGILQITEALSYLHYSGNVVHRNVCPSSILVTRKGTWKLAGLEFIERLSSAMNAPDTVSCQPWSPRMSKMTQPNLDYYAPESQLHSKCSVLSDMFSLGLVICAIYNKGRPVIQANNNVSLYWKQVESLNLLISKMLFNLPVNLQGSCSRLTFKEPIGRPTAQMMQINNFFVDPGVQALQFLDVINMKDPQQKTHFYRNTLRDALKHIPRREMQTAEVLAAVLQPAIQLVQEATSVEYENIILPTFRVIFVTPKTIQANVTILENLHIILEKTKREEIRTEVLPLMYNAFESTYIQVQSAALVAVINVYDSLDEVAIQKMVLPKLKLVFEKNQNDLKIVANVLQCIERIMDKLEKTQITEDVLSMLLSIHLFDPEIIVRVVYIYRIMLGEKKYSIPCNIMATQIIPTLAPQTVNAALSLDQYTLLIETIQDFLDHIDRQQRNKLKLESRTHSSPERHRPLRHQYSSDNMNVPPFNIPNLRIDQRKTSSAEDMARKNSTGSGIMGWWFGGGSPSSPDRNFLGVSNVFPNRRLSDNTLMTPKIHIAPSSHSSPGGTPGGGLPIRRHSSIGPQERRTSQINLSPPNAYGFSNRGNSGSSLSVPSSSAYVGGSMPNTSSSVPFLLSSSLQSIRSRRTSNTLTSGPLGSGSGLLQQLGSGMVRQLPVGGSTIRTAIGSTGSVGGCPGQFVSAYNGLVASNACTTNTMVRHNSVRKCPSLNITFSH